jgi:hypothetical protein
MMTCEMALEMEGLMNLIRILSHRVVYGRAPLDVQILASSMFNLRQKSV